MAAPDYYALLGVPRNATTAEVRKAFRGKALEQHPDRGGDEESFRLLSKAYDVLSDQERRKYYDRTGRPERTAEDDFLDGFGKKSAETPKRDESAALAQRLDASHEESHAKSFEAWMRSRNGESMVVTTESLLNDKKNIAADSYEKVLLPRVRSTTIRVTPSIAKGDLLKRAAQRTEVHYRKLPKHLDWKECLVNVRSAPLTLPDLRNAADGTNDLGCSCVGVVETVGPGTTLLKEGDWVVPLSDTMGTFSSLRVWDEKDLLKIDRDVMPVEYASLWRELALAYHLLETEASELKAGDAVLISAANGAVGQILIQLRTASAMSLGGPPVRVEVLKAKARFPTTPVRLLCGSDDEAFSVQSCESVVGGLSEIVPDARLEVVAGGRHDVSLAEVEALAAALQACAKPSQ